MRVYISLPLATAWCSDKLDINEWKEKHFWSPILHCHINVQVCWVLLWTYSRYLLHIVNYTYDISFMSQKPQRLHLFTVGVWCHFIEVKPFESPLKVNPVYNRWWTLVAGLPKYSRWHNPGLTFWIVVCVFSTSERRVKCLLNVHVRHIIKWISTRPKGKLAVAQVHLASLC